MPNSVTVTGDDAAARKLRNTGRRALNQRDTFADEARDAQRRITGIPVRTGRLAASARGGAETLREVSATGYRVGSKVPYARFVFQGTRHMAAQPPRVPNDLGRSAAQAIGRDLRRA